MRKKSMRFFAGFIALSVSFGALPTSAFAFDDTTGHWAKNEIDYMFSKGLISGYENNTFKPNNPITRAEVSVVLQNRFNFTNDTTEAFRDVEKGSWYENAVHSLKSQNIISGLEDGIFSPHSNITRQDIAVILTKLYAQSLDGDYSDALSSFADSGNISAYAKNAVGFLVEKGYMHGREDGNLHPQAIVTRAEFIKLFYLFDTNVAGTEDTTPAVAEEEEKTANNSSKSNSSGGSSSGGSGNGGSSQTQSVAVNLEKTGIVEVEGVFYAVVALDKAPESLSDLTFKISGQEAVFEPSAVNASGNILKIQLPDGTERTLSVSKTGDSKSQTIVTLKEIGNSVKTNSEVNASVSTDNKEPYIVLTKENISLEQYLKFIELGENIFVKQDTSTVNTALVKSASFDVVTNATTNTPPEFDSVTVDATIAVNFDMLANNIIADKLNIPATNATTLLDKWDDLEQGIVLNKDFSLYGEKLGDAVDNDISAATLPKYVKYLTSSGLYGTKVYFETSQPDSQTAPAITMETTLIGKDAIAHLSEENETWYRYLTEIGIPYGMKTYGYNDIKTISEDGRTITLPIQDFGPMHKADKYEVTFKSHGFYKDVIVSFEVVQEAAIVTSSWDDAEGHLSLRADYTTYFPSLEKIIVNGVELALEDDIEQTGFYNLNIPYKYLQNGDNTIKIISSGFAEQEITITSPVGFITPKKAPILEMADVIANTKIAVINYEDFETDSEEAAWLGALALEHITIDAGYSTYNVIGIEKDTASKKITMTTDKTFSTYHDVTFIIKSPDYEVVKLAFTPVYEVTALVGNWTDANSYKITLDGSSYSSYLGGINEVILDGTILVKGVDYEGDSYGLEIYAQNFKENATHQITLVEKGYADYVETVIIPSDFVKPKVAPELSVETTLQGEDVYVTFLDGADWASKILKVTLKASSSTSTSSVSDWDIVGDSIEIPANAFSDYNDYTLTFFATGYENTSIDVNVVKSVTLTPEYKENDVQVEITSYNSNGYTDYSYYGYIVTVVLNGTPLTLNTNYTLKNFSSTMSIDANYFNQDKNVLEIVSKNYADTTLIIDKIEAPADAPALTMKEDVMAGDNRIILSTGDAEWLENVTVDSIKLNYGYSSTLAISSIEKGVDTLTIITSSNLSIRDYTAEIKADGYRTTSIAFKPFTQTPELSTEWTDDGLKITVDDTSSPYMYYSFYFSISVDETVLTDKQYSFKVDKDTREDYLVINADVFTEFLSYEIALANSSSSYNYKDETITYEHVDSSSFSAFLSAFPEMSEDAEDIAVIPEEDTTNSDGTEGNDTTEPKDDVELDDATNEPNTEENNLTDLEDNEDMITNESDPTEGVVASTEEDDDADDATSESDSNNTVDSNIVETETI